MLLRRPGEVPDGAVAVDEVGTVRSIVDRRPVSADVPCAFYAGLGGAVHVCGQFIPVEFEDVGVSAFEDYQWHRAFGICPAVGDEKVKCGCDAGRAVRPGYEYQHRGSAPLILSQHFAEVGGRLICCGQASEGFSIVDIEKCLKCPDFRRILTPLGIDLCTLPVVAARYCCE